MLCEFPLSFSSFPIPGLLYALARTSFPVHLPSVPITCWKADNRLDVFFEHHRLFFDLSIPKFRSRLTFHDRRRPSLALLNAMVRCYRQTHTEKLTDSTCGQAECRTRPICPAQKRISTNKQSSIWMRPQRLEID